MNNAKITQFVCQYSMVDSYWIANVGTMPIASITKNVSRPAFMSTNIQSELFQLDSVMAIHIVSTLIKCMFDD